MHTLLQDLRFAFRQLKSSPGFAVLAALTLAFGIGANTAMFTVVESVLVRPLPYAHPERLVGIGLPVGSRLDTTSWLNYRDIRDQTNTMSAVGAYASDVGVVRGKEGSVPVATPGVTTNVFQILGARPLLGRTFSDEEGRLGGPKSDGDLGRLVAKRVQRRSGNREPDDRSGWTTASSCRRHAEEFPLSRVHG